ncbi:hypothetical protein D3C85_1272390 [compost metagenome]
MTWLTLGKSIPRAATSVAMRKGTSPAWNLRIDSMRLLCSISPRIQAQETPAACNWPESSASRSRVLTKTMAFWVSGSFRMWISSASLWAASSARCTHWVIGRRSLRGGSACSSTGSLRISLANFSSPAPSRVAENSMVCLR